MSVQYKSLELLNNDYPDLIAMPVAATQAGDPRALNVLGSATLRAAFTVMN